MLRRLFQNQSCVARRLARRCILPGLVLGSVDPVGAGFLQPPGSTLLISSAKASRFSQNFNARGRLERARQFSKLSVETYVEQGFTHSRQ